MSLEKLVTISSNDQDVNLSNSNSDFTVVLNERNLSQGVNRVMIKECTVPNVFPNIRGESYGSSQNNIFRFQDGLGNLSSPVEIPEGQYVISTLGVPPANDLITVLETIYNATVALPGETVSITLDPITNKLNFTFAGGITGYNFANTSDSPLNNSLGIVGPLPSASLNFDAQGIPDLVGYKNVYIHSKDIADLNGVDAGFGLISLAEPVSLVDTPYGAYSYKKNNDDELASIVFEQPRNLSVIRIVLRDENGVKLDIGSHTMNIVFKAYFDAV